MKKNILILLFPIFSYGQQLITEKIYNNFKKNGWCNYIDTSCTKGYLISAGTLGDAFSISGMFMQTDSLGNSEWTKFLDPKEHCVAFYVTFPNFCFNDNVYFSSIWNYWGTTFNINPKISKFSKMGESQFSTIYNYNDSDYHKRVQLNAFILDYDQNLLSMGLGSSLTLTGIQNGWGKYSLLKIKPNGEEVFNKIFFFSKYPENYRFFGVLRAADLKKYPPQNYVIYGDDGELGTGNPVLIKLNKNYDTISTKSYLQPQPNQTFDPKLGNLLYTMDKKFVVSGRNINRSVVMKVDTSLNEIWIKSFGVGNSSTNKIFELKNDTILVVTIQVNTNRIWFYKLRGSDGAIVDSTFIISTICGSNKTLGNLRGAVLRNNGHLAICGNGDIEAFGFGYPKPYFALIQMPRGTRPAPVQVFGVNTLVSGIVEKEKSNKNKFQSLFSIIPNPSQGNANITIQNIEKTYHLVIYNAQGAIVYNHISNKSEHEIQNFKSGIYQVILIIDGKSEHQKWLVE